MSIRNGIYDLLSALEADVYPVIAPQETAVTYIVYTLRRETIRDQAGPNTYEVFLTLNIFANELDDAVAMAATMEAGLDDASGTYDGETLHVCNFVNEGGDYVVDPEGRGKYMIQQEYQLLFAA